MIRLQTVVTMLRNMKESSGEVVVLTVPAWTKYEHKGEGAEVGRSDLM